MKISEENLTIEIDNKIFDFDEASYKDDMSVDIEMEDYKGNENLKFDFSDFDSSFFISFHSSNGFETDLFYEVEIYKDISPSTVKISFNCHEPNKYWEGKWGLTTFLSTLYSLMLEDKLIKSLELDVENDWKILEVVFETEETGFILQDLLAEKSSLLKNYISKTERFLSGKIWLEEFERNEKLFCTDLLLPLLRKMDFIDVKFTHGTREYGKDFTFSEVTKFGNLRHYALQAKAGNVRGNVNSDIDEIIGQLDDAFSMSYFEISANEERLINTFVVAISGYFTDNAKDKIARKIPPNLKGSVYFIDKDKVLELVEKYYK